MFLVECIYVQIYAFNCAGSKLFVRVFIYIEYLHIYMYIYIYIWLINCTHLLLYIYHFITQSCIISIDICLQTRHMNILFYVWVSKRVLYYVCTCLTNNLSCVMGNPIAPSFSNAVIQRLLEGEKTCFVPPFVKVGSPPLRLFVDGLLSADTCIYIPSLFSFLSSILYKLLNFILLFI